MSIAEEEVMTVSNFLKRKRLGNGSSSVTWKEILVKEGKREGVLR